MLYDKERGNSMNQNKMQCQQCVYNNARFSAVPRGLM